MKDDQPEKFDLATEIKQWIDRAESGETIIVPADFYGLGRGLTKTFALKLMRVAPDPKRVKLVLAKSRQWDSGVPPYLAFLLTH